MAAGERALKRRIKVVKNTQQITKAMKMVAAAKLKVAQTKIEAAAPYTDKMEEILNNLLQATQDLTHPLTETRNEIKRVLVVVYTSDRGLCGSFNTNMIRKAQSFIKELQSEGKDVAIYAVGKRGYNFFSKRNYHIQDHEEGLQPSLSFLEAKEISQKIKDLYVNEIYDIVHMCYPKFINTVSIVPSIRQFLPLEPEMPDEEQTASHADYIFEPEAEELFNSLIPRYVDMQFYRLLIESLTSEFAARMTAMTAATDNADEVIRDLTIKYNKMRQSAITAELLDIVGGANALEA